MLLALLIAAPWLEMQAGPSLARTGAGGPLVRMNVGVSLGERGAAELWLSGAMVDAPLTAPGDSALLGGGAGGRVLLHAFDAEKKLGLWMHGGVGYSLAAAGPAERGPEAFAGPVLSYQPFVKRFSLGAELDALATRNSIGLALLPSLRCSF